MAGRPTPGSRSSPSTRTRRRGPRARAAGRVPVHARPVRGHVPRAAVDDPPVRGLRIGRGDERALPLPARAWADRALGRVRPSDAARLRLGRPARRRRGGADRRRDRLDRRHGAPLRPDPARRGLDVDDDQRAGVAAPAAVRARRRGAGRQGRAAPRHRPERHPQGVLRARELHLPAEAVDAPDDRSLRVCARAAAEVEHDLDLRVPHPRGGLDRRPGARVHARERDRLCAGRCRRRALAGRVRRAALVLLQRAQPFLPGGREVPGGTAALGRDHARAVRRDEPEGAGASLPRTDRRLDAHGAAAGEQHRPRGYSGLVRSGRRRPVDPHERVRRGARAADGALREDRPPDAATPDARGRRNGHGRSVSAARTSSRP